LAYPAKSIIANLISDSGARGLNLAPGRNADMRDNPLSTARSGAGEAALTTAFVHGNADQVSDVADVVA
jgi:hypothetical protein